MIYNGIKYFTDAVNFDTSLVNQILSSKFHNDYIMERAFFEVDFSIKIDDKDDGVFKTDVIRVAYRLLFEQIYLRRCLDHLSKIKVLDSKTIQVSLKVSISEALDYVSSVTPPIFRDSTLSNIKTVNDLKSMVDFYLNDKSSHDYAYKLDVFYKHTCLYQFPTEWKYDNTRFDIILNKFMDVPANPAEIGVVDISSKRIQDFKDMFNDPDTDVIHTPLQFSLKFDFNYNRFLPINVIKFINNPIYSILDVKYDEPNNVLYMTIYTESVDKNLMRHINTWYSRL